MKHSTMFVALIALASLTACQKPAVVNVPPSTVGAPGPAGSQGEPGKPGEATTVIVVPAASSPTH